MGKYDIDMDLSGKIGCLNAYLNIYIYGCDENTCPTNAFLEYEMPDWVGVRIVFPSGM